MVGRVGKADQEREEVVEDRVGEADQKEMELMGRVEKADQKEAEMMGRGRPEGNRNDRSSR